MFECVYARSRATSFFLFFFAYACPNASLAFSSLRRFHFSEREKVRNLFHRKAHAHKYHKLKWLWAAAAVTAYVRVLHYNQRGKNVVQEVCES